MSGWAREKVKENEREEKTVKGIHYGTIEILYMCVCVEYCSKVLGQFDFFFFLMLLKEFFYAHQI